MAGKRSEPKETAVAEGEEYEPDQAVNEEYGKALDQGYFGEAPEAAEEEGSESE